MTPEPADRKRYFRIHLSALPWIVAASALMIALFLNTFRHNAQLMEMTRQHNAQLMEQTERFNAQLLEMTARHNAQLKEMAASFQKESDRAPEGATEAGGAGALSKAGVPR
jgi:hypothetical protein